MVEVRIEKALSVLWERAERHLHLLLKLLGVHDILSFVNTFLLQDFYKM